MKMPIAKLKHYYESFGQVSLDYLDEIYAKDVVFIDPLHQINGIEALKRYFSETCENLSYCRFIFIEEIASEQSVCLKWRMEYSHSAIKNNARLELVGTSILQFSEGLITSHEDFYDMGSMVYEHIPLLGGAIRMIKSRMTNVA